jgi:hypothetical protein
MRASAVEAGSHNRPSRAWIVIAVVLVSVGFAWILLPLREGLEAFERWTTGLGVWGVALFVLVYVLATISLAPEWRSLRACLLPGYWQRFDDRAVRHLDRDRDRRRRRPRHRQQPCTQLGDPSAAMGKRSLADDLAASIDQADLVRLACPVDAREPLGIICHYSPFPPQPGHRDACRSLYWRSRRNSSPDLHRGQPAEVRLPPKCSKHRGQWVALDRLARSRQSTNQTGLWTR